MAWFIIISLSECSIVISVSKHCVQTLKVPETVWRAAKEQNSQLVTASVESWDWIHYLVEPSVVDYEYRGKEDDKACAQNIS